MIIKGKIAVSVDADGIHIDAERGAQGVVTVTVVAGKDSQTRTLDLTESAKLSRTQTTEKLAARAVSVDESEVRMAWLSR